jgi:hypothetical protein
VSDPDPRRWRILGVTLVVGFMSLLDVTIVNVALPSIQQGLGTSAATVQWIVSGYALAFGLTLVTGGRLGDAYGRRRLMLIGLTGFIVSSAAVGLAPVAWVAVAARLVQGLSAGLLTPQNSGLIRARPRLRCVRLHRLDLLRDRPDPGRPDHRGLRRRPRLALHLPGQRADRAGRPGADRPDGPRAPGRRRRQP